MAQPYEIVAAPLARYVAEGDTVAPAIDDDDAAIIAAGWSLVGKSGTRNISDEGVTVTHSQEISRFTPAGATVPRKVWRTAEGLIIAASIADVSVEAYAMALNDAEITTVAADVGVPGQKSIDLFQGDQVATFALLARGLSPEDETLAAQYVVPRVFQGSDSIEITYNKGEPALLTLEFEALSDDSGDFGEYIVGTEPAEEA